MSAPKKNAKALSKAVRFEVLKRDKFACQYCGAKAPEVLLHVDHIHPRAKGGANDLVDGKATADSSRIAFRSALSTLDYKAQNDADPLGSQARYIRGILRRRLYARWDPATLEQITSALRLGASFQLLKDAACNIPNWAEWDGHIERVIEDLS